jgi:hypothetical protein
LLPLLLVILFPLAAYCVFLALLNRRVQPTPVPGAWDFLAALSALAGLLLYAVPQGFTAFMKKRLHETLYAGGKPAPETAQSLSFWLWVGYAAYYALVVGGGALLVWLRRNKTVVYNVSPEDLDRALNQALAGLRLGVTRAGRRRYIGPGGAPVPQPERVPEPYLAAITAAPLGVAGDGEAAPARAVLGEAVLDVEPFPALSNVTLHWRSHSGTVRQEVEEELAKALKEVRTYDNSAGTWLLGISGFLFALIFMLVMTLILGPYVRTR